MARFDPVPDLAVDDQVDETYVDAVTKMLNYMGIGGANIVSSATIAISSRYHVITGTTTIDTISDALGAVAGQPLDLYTQSALTFRNNGGGTGNIRTISGGDRITRAGELVSFIYDGSVWRERNQLPGAELSYVEFTAAVTVSATTEATANTVVTAAAVTLDGATTIEVDFFVPQISSGTDGGECHIVLFDGTAIGELADWQRGASGGSMYTAIMAKRRLTPSAGSHTYSIRAWRATANCTLTAGAGGAGVKVPGFIRVRRLA